MYPEGARELELKLESDFGRAAMHVACAYLFQQVFTHCWYLLQKRHPTSIALFRAKRVVQIYTAASNTRDKACLALELGDAGTSTQNRGDRDCLITLLSWVKQIIR